MTLRPALALLFLLAACASQMAPDPARTVMAREREWLDAYENRDAQVMADILHDDFVITYSNGARQNKEQVVAFISSQRQSGKPAPRFHTERITAHVAAGVVVLSGIVVTETAASRKEELYTDTYVFERGVWRVLASQLAPVSPPR